MKRLLLLSAIAAGTAALQAQTQADYKWCSTYDDGAPMCNVNAICPAGDGSYFMAGTIGAGASTLMWNQQDITPEGGMNVTYQKGFTVGKVQADGSMLWSVTSNTANVANNDIFIAATPDGGVAMACNATYSTAGAGAPVLITVCGTGDSEPLTISSANAAEGKSPYAGVVIKFDKDGAIEWYDVVAANPFGGAEGNVYDANPINFKSLAADESGNVYVGGFNKTEATYSTTSDNGILPASANSATNAAGTALTDGSSGFILKYEPMTGHHAVNEPAMAWQNNGQSAYAGLESVCGLTCDGTTLYFAMLANGLSSADYLLNGVDIAINNELSGNVVYGAIATEDMRLMSANALAAEKGNSTTHATQVKNFQLIDGVLALSMSANGSFSQNGDMITGTSTNKYEGVTVTISTATLNAVQGYCSGKNIGGDFLAIIDEEANTTYTAGYVMSDGILLHAFDTATGEYKNSTQLSEKISSISGACFNAETKDILVCAYAKDLGTLCGSEATAPVFSAFHGYLLCANLPQVNATSGIGAVEAGFSPADASAPAEYYSLQGIRIASPAPGTLVIRRQGNQVSKLIVR
ncbi:MAG: hypothetical protein K2K36_04135 [Muribaculaceae bacterium]|nr:hypothetical protein [Muribaculaceae bacterium]